MTTILLLSMVLSAQLSHTVWATRIGLVGKTTATGHVIREGDLFVALPSRLALRKMVRITYAGTTIVVPVWDVGPHYTDDPYWIMNRRPRAEKTRRNRAGIDLSDGAWDALGAPRALGRMRVTWRFN